MPLAKKSIDVHYIALTTGFLIILGLFVFLNIDIITRMMGTWYNTTTFQHCFFVLPLSLWLMWERRHLIALSAFQPIPALGSFFGLVISVTLLGIGILSGFNLFEQIGLIATSLSLFWLWMGHDLTRIMGFPLLFLFLMVPFGTELIPTLQIINAKVGTFLLTFSGVPATREGITITTANSHFIVAEACAGLRFLIANFMVGVLFAGLIYKKVWKMALLIGISLLIPFLGNMIRIYIVMMIAHFSHNTYGVGFDHLVYGWGFFSLLMLFNLWIGTCFKDSMTNMTPISAHQNRITPIFLNKFWILYSVALIFSLSILGVVFLLKDEVRFQKTHLFSSQTLAWNTLFEPTLHLDTAAPLEHNNNWKPNLHNPDEQLVFKGDLQGKPIEIWIGTWKAQFEDHKSVYFASTIDDEDYWLRLNQGSIQLKIQDGLSISVPVYTLGQLGGEKIMAVPFYGYLSSDDQTLLLTPSASKAKKNQFFRTLYYKPAMGSFVVFKFPVLPDAEITSLLETLIQKHLE